MKAQRYGYRFYVVSFHDPEVGAVEYYFPSKREAERAAADARRQYRANCADPDDPADKLTTQVKERRVSAVKADLIGFLNRYATTAAGRGSEAIVPENLPL